VVTLGFVRELGDNLTPEQVTKMATDAAHLIFGKPKTYIESGVERPLSDADRVAMAEAFLGGSVARLAQWWRDGEEANVAAVVNALDEDVLRMLAVRAIVTLADIGYAVVDTSRLPEQPDDSSLN
jgi:hypothetical protein